jgi:AcrR family transcriptional regulator
LTCAASNGAEAYTTSYREVKDYCNFSFVKPIITTERYLSDESRAANRPLPIDGYRPSMLQTPWGEADSLRDQQAAAGGGRDATKREQRERLFAAMVACCERKGYEATSVADLLELSGVSRGTFYALFDDKLDCFRATEQQLIRGGVAAASNPLGEAGDAEARAREAFEVLVDLVVSQPAAARMVLVHAYAAGEPGLAPLRTAMEGIADLAHQTLERMPGKEGMPADLVKAIVGGVYLIIYRHLHRNREAELPGLTEAMWDWAMSYAPPLLPLRPSGRRPSPAPAGPLPPFAAYSPEQRIIRAFAAVVAEKGYPATTVADISARAGISQTTLYLHFADKKDLLVAALDSSGAQLLAATMPAARRAPDWPSSVRAAIEAGCAFLASEPAFARLRMVGVYSAGPEAISIRNQSGMEFMAALLAPARAEGSEVPDIFLEAMSGAIFGILYERVRNGDPGDLLEAVPLITYLVLSPFIGAERACEIATGKRTRPTSAASS